MTNDVMYESICVSEKDEINVIVEVIYNFGIDRFIVYSCAVTCTNSTVHACNIAS